MASGTIKRAGSTISRISKAFTISAKSAGSSGYLNITFDSNNITDSNQVISMKITSSNIAASKGLQLTPFYYAENTRVFYFNYYCPQAITETLNFTADLYYLE